MMRKNFKNLALFIGLSALSLHPSWGEAPVEIAEGALEEDSSVDTSESPLSLRGGLGEIDALPEDFSPISRPQAIEKTPGKTQESEGEAPQVSEEFEPEMGNTEIDLTSGEKPYGPPGPKNQTALYTGPNISGKGPQRYLHNRRKYITPEVRKFLKIAEGTGEVSSIPELLMAPEKKELLLQLTNFQKK